MWIGRRRRSKAERKRHIVIFIIAALLLLTAAGCGSDKELWEVLEEQQYNNYKPLLDHMVEKYGDMFEMNVYGDVYCTEPEYHNWRIRIAGDNIDVSPIDNFSIRLKRDDIELFIQEIAEPILGECKVYVYDGFPSKLDGDAEPEDFLTYKQGLVCCCIYVPYSENYQIQGDTFMTAIIDCNYKMKFLDILYADEAQYKQVDRDGITPGHFPKGYKFRLDARFINSTGKFSFKWEEAEE